jgi:hypothetical protein
MDFSWTSDQLDYAQAVKEFAKRKLRDDVSLRDVDAEFSRSLWDACAEFGIQGLPFPQQYGGQAADIMTVVLAMEALGHAWKDNGLIFGINAQMWSVQMPILRFGTELQKATYLPKLCSGTWVGAHGMSEPGSGSDAFSMRTTAIRDGSDYVLRGSKTFVSGAPVADLFLVFASTERQVGFFGITAFLVERDTPGFQVGKPIGKMGLRTFPWAELVFENCRISGEQRLGKEGIGAAIFSDSMEWERSCLLAAHLGAMHRQLEECIEYARTRKQFGIRIGKFQSVAHRIVDMKIRLETSRLLLYRVAWLKSRGERSAMDAALAKVYLTEAWTRSSLDALQIHGGYGYTTEYGIERDVRDAVGGLIYSGTSDIQKNIIASSLGL